MFSISSIKLDRMVPAMDSNSYTHTVVPSVQSIYRVKLSAFLRKQFMQLCLASNIYIYAESQLVYNSLVGLSKMLILAVTAQFP